MGRSVIGGSLVGYRLLSTDWWLADSSVDLKFTTGQYYDGADGADVTTLLSCSRASIGYAQTAAGTLTQFAANELRITDKGLLIENTRENSTRSSQDFSDAWWTKYNSSIGSTTTAPDGTNTAQKLVADTAPGTYHMVEASSSGSGSRLTLTLYMKAAGYNYAFLRGGQGLSNDSSILIDLTNGTIVDSATSGSGAPGLVTSVETLANGWYRARITSSSAMALFDFGPVPTSSPTWSSEARPLFAGDGSSGVYFWGIQCESGTFPSSYIPTTSAAATRAGDLVTFAGSLDTVMNASPASIVVDVKYEVPSSFVSSSFARIVTSYPANGIPFFVVGGDTSLGSTDNSSNTLNTTITGTFTAGVKIGLAYTSGARSLTGGGAAVASDANGDMANSMKLRDTANHEFFYYRRLTVWNTKLADATLQGFTNP
jgi:hypothetical protein